MAATVIINEKNGAGETATDKTSGTLRCKNADDATVDVNDPLVVPTANTEYSFQKWCRLEITGGTYTQIDNLLAYSDGSNGFGAGRKLWYAVDGTYSTPVVPTETDDPPHHDAVDMTDFFTATSGSPIDMDGNNSGPFTSDAEIGDYLVLVMEIEIGSAAGVLTAETLTFSYDEI